MNKLPFVSKFFSWNITKLPNPLLAIDEARGVGKKELILFCLSAEAIQEILSVFFALNQDLPIKFMAHWWITTLFHVTYILMINTISCFDWKTLPFIEKIIITMRKFLKFAMIQNAATQIKLNVTYDVSLWRTLCKCFFRGGGKKCNNFLI